jgi:hypothetical protein
MPNLKLDLVFDDRLVDLAAGGFDAVSCAMAGSSGSWIGIARL